MIGLDTNVVVRYLVQDDPRQSAAASALIDGLSDEAPGLISLVTLVELYWVLRRAYGVDAAGCVELIGAILESRELRVDRAAVVRSALGLAREGVDFADAVVAATGRHAGCDRTMTFDRRAAREGVMELLTT